MDFSRYEPGFVSSTVDVRMLHLGETDRTRYLQRIGDGGDETELNALKAAFCVSYSGFFRDPLVFGFLESVIIPDLLEQARKAGRTEIRAWSAACADGREAYSLAMLLDAATSSGPGGLSWRIFATDISDSALNRGMAGIYDADAAGMVRKAFLDKYFSGMNGVCAILPDLKNRVDFSRFDLVSDSGRCPPTCIYGDLDIIICSNVLLYHSVGARRTILSRLASCLSPSGYLITDRSESGSVDECGLFRPLTIALPLYRHGVES